MLLGTIEATKIFIRKHINKKRKFKSRIWKLRKKKGYLEQVMDLEVFNSVSPFNLY